MNIVIAASEGIGFFAIFSGFIGLIITIIWVAIGWRAMRAHERLAELANLHLQHIKSNSPDKKSNEKIMEQYQKFMSEVKEASDLPFQERQVMFKAWLLEQ